MWISIIADDSLACEREEACEKESRCNHMDDCFSKNIARHVPLNWSKMASKFLQFTNLIRVELTGKRFISLCWIGTQNTSKLFFEEMQELRHG